MTTINDNRSSFLSALGTHLLGGLLDSLLGDLGLDNLRLGNLGLDGLHDLLSDLLGGDFLGSSSYKKNIYFNSND